MKFLHTFVFLALLLAVSVSVKAELVFNFQQVQEKILSISDDGFVTTYSGNRYILGNNHLGNLHQYVGLEVFLKFYKVLEKDYYVDMGLVSEGGFDIDEKKVEPGKSGPR